MNVNPTRHARKRMCQRGFHTGDIDIIVELGTVVRPGLHVLRNRDAYTAIRECKHRIQTLERLRGSAVVVEDGALITCFHIAGAPGRRALVGRPRRSRQQDHAGADECLVRSARGDQ